MRRDRPSWLYHRRCSPRQQSHAVSRVSMPALPIAASVKTFTTGPTTNPSQEREKKSRETEHDTSRPGPPATQRRPPARRWAGCEPLTAHNSRHGRQGQPPGRRQPSQWVDGLLLRATHGEIRPNADYLRPELRLAVALMALRLSSSVRVAARSATSLWQRTCSSVIRRTAKFISLMVRRSRYRRNRSRSRPVQETSSSARCA
jgi:hypothetical protein